MEFKTIQKSAEAWKVTPNLIDYETTYHEFSWDNLLLEIDGLPNGAGLNIAHEAIDRHANGPLRHKLALRWLGANGDIRDYTVLVRRVLSPVLQRSVSRVFEILTSEVIALGGTVKEYPGDAVLEGKPLIDEFGQYTHADWPGKAQAPALPARPPTESAPTDFRRPQATCRARGPG